MPFQHLRKDTSHTPNVDCDIVFLPGKHNFRRTVVPRGDVSGHLGILDTSESKITNLRKAPVRTRMARQWRSDGYLQITVFVYQDIAWFLPRVSWSLVKHRPIRAHEIAVNNASRVNIFETSLELMGLSCLILPYTLTASYAHQDLVQKILHKLFLEGLGS
jgi:hypothetical protein